MTDSSGNSDPRIEDAEDAEDAEDEDHSVRKVAKAPIGMTIGRFRRIQEAEANGETVELSEAERTQYEETGAKMAELGARMQKEMNATFEPLNKQIKSILNDSLPRLSTLPMSNTEAILSQIDPSILRAAPAIPKIEPRRSLIDREWLDEISEAEKERSKQAVQTNENISLLAAVAQDMLTVASKQRDLMIEQSLEIEKQASNETRRHRQTMWVMVPTLIASITIPLLLFWLAP